MTDEQECQHSWKEIDGIACESCGDHMGLMCEWCYEVIDLVYYGDPRDAEVV
ncbi:MAG: hypothetical protein ACM3UO_00100 [Bacillota bacterium]